MRVVLARQSLRRGSAVHLHASEIRLARNGPRQQRHRVTKTDDDTLIESAPARVFRSINPAFECFSCSHGNRRQANEKNSGATSPTMTSIVSLASPISVRASSSNATGSKRIKLGPISILGPIARLVTDLPANCPCFCGGSCPCETETTLVSPQ